MYYYTVHEEFVTVLGLKGVDLLVFSIIYNAVAHMNGFVSITAITNHSGASRSHVCRVLKKFEDQGWITKTPEGRRKKNRYQIKVLTVGQRAKPILASNFTSITKSPVSSNEKDKYYPSKVTSTGDIVRLPIVTNL